MRDPEFIQLRNRFFFGVGLSLLFMVPLIIFLVKTYGVSSVLTKVEKKETFTVVVTAKNCDNCKLVTDILKDKDVKFVKLNRSTNKNYDEIMKKLNIVNKREEFPVIIYVKDGVMQANLFSINSEKMVNDFIEYHGLNNTK